jgi:peroxiredoxin
MKIIIALLLPVVFILSCHDQKSKIPKQEIPEDYGYIVKIGQQVPDVKLVLTDGTTLSTGSLKGKVVMLQFTASWCSVCRQEMPHIENEIWQKYKDRNDFALIGIDLDEPLETVIKFASDLNITYPMALDPKGEIFYTFAARGAGVTRNVIIDKKGKIVYMTRLYKEEEFNEMKEVIRLLLEKS